MSSVSETLDHAPSADEIASYREEASQQDDSVAVRYPHDDGARELVVSPRGTCVVLENNTSNDALNPDTATTDVAEACTA
jgi:hypothetical protein